MRRNAQKMQRAIGDVFQGKAALVAACMGLASLGATAQQMPSLSVPSAPKAVSGHVAGRIMVKFREGVTPVISNGPDGVRTNIAALEELNQRYNCIAVKRLYTGKKNINKDFSYTFDFPKTTNVEKLVDAYRASGYFEVVSPDHLVGIATTTPNDAYFQYSWGMYNTGAFAFNSVPSIAGRDIDMRLAWDLTQGSSSITVAVIDAGIKLDHPEFSGRIWTNSGEIAANGVDDDGNGFVDDVQGWDWVNSDNNPTDDNGHGVNVSGIIGANGNNSIGYAGMDWNCKIMALKTQGASGSGSTADIIEAIYYATDQGAKVINMSLGGSGSVSLFQDAINYAYSNKVTVVAAMGNSNSIVPSYPAAYSHVIAVGATRCDDHRASFSNYGSHISVVAPGEAIFGLSYLSNTDYTGGMSGTSQATPHVAGLVSLMLALDATKTPDQIKAIIEATAEDHVGVSTEDVVGFDNYHGWGRINAYQALLYCTNPAAITGSNNICVGATTTLADATTGGTWSSSNTAVATIATGGVVSGVAAGMVTITYKKLSCYATFTLTVKPKPSTVSITPTTSSICLGNSTPFTASSAASAVTLLSENWNSGYLNGWSASCTDPSGYACWQIRNSPGYTGTVTGDGTAYMQAAPAASGGTTTVLTSPSFSTVGYTSGSLTYNQHFLAYTGDATVAVQYSINGGSTWTTLVNQLGTSVTGTTWTAATPQVTATLPTGALGQSNVMLRWNYSSTSGAYWAVDNIVVKATAPVTFTWTGVGTATGLSCSVCSSPTITPTAMGANVYSVTATANGCSVTGGVTMNVSGGTPGTISGASTVCAATTTTLTNTAGGGTWSSSSTAVATVNATSGVVTGVAAGSVTITYNTSCGVATKAMTVNPAANAGTITGTVNVCVGNAATLSNTISGGSWFSGASGVAAVSGGVVTGIAPGTAVISYVVTNSCGTATATKVATVSAAPNAGTITGSSNVCTGSMITLSSSGTGGAWSSPSTGTATVNSAGAVTGVSVGSLLISYTVTNGCGSAVATAFVMVNPAANAGTITGTVNVCVGNSATLSNTTSGGSWTSGATGIATVSGGVVTGVAPGTAVISYVVTNSCGTATATRIATVNAAPNAGTIAGSSNVCTGSMITLSSSVTGGTWSSPSPGTATVNSTGVVTGVSVGSLMISYTVANGCGPAVAMAFVMVNAAPDAGAITGVGTVCTGNTISLSNTATGGSWTSGMPGVASVDASGVVSGIATGTARISYTATTSCGSAFATKIVTVNGLPNAGTITGASLVFVGNTITLSNTVSGGAWSSTDTGIATVNGGGVVTGINVGSTSISYTVTNSCGSSTATAMVFVDTLTGVSGISGDLTVCVASTTSLSGGTPGGTWTSSNTTKATVSAAGVVTGVAAGTSTISYNLSGSISTAIVTVNAALPAITGTAKACPGTSTTLSNTVTGGTWSSSNGSVATIDAASGVVTGAIAGTTTIVYAAGGCTKSVIVTINATPTIGGSLSRCPGNTASLTCSPAATSWFSSSTSIATITSAGLVTALSAGTTTISVIANTGCTNEVVFTVTSLPDPIGGALNTCIGATTSLTNTTGGGTWSSSITGIASINTGGVVTGANAGTTTISYSLGAGCTRTAVVTVSALPTVAGSPVMCVGNSVALAGSPAGGGWSSANPAIAIVGSTGIVTGQSSGTTSIMYTAITGCARSIVATVSNTPGSFSGASSICLNAVTTLTNAVAGGTWTSNAPLVASAGVATGAITGVGVGTATITYKIGVCLATTSISVMALPSAITGTAKACPGTSTTLSTVSVGGTWSSANPSVAEVDTNGVVSGITAGTVSIMYIGSNSCTKSIVATVNPAPNGLTGTRGMCVGAATTLASTTPGVLAWTSSDITKATVSATGVVTGVAAGTAEITYKITTGCYTTAEVTVSTLPSPITGTLSACTNATTTLSCATPGGSWSSSNPSIAPIDTNGVVTGMVAGPSLIVYSVVSGCSASASVTILAGASAITGPLVVCESTTMYPYLACVGSGTWSSSDPTVATVPPTHGAVAGVSAGTAIISFTIPTGCSSIRIVSVDVCPSRGMNSGTTGVVAPTAGHLNISLYPNPTKGAFTFTTPEGGSLTIYSLEGREVMSRDLKEGTTELSIPLSMASGVYVCRFTGEAGNTTTVRLVYEKE
jgi:subtilisin family serine protease/uncharacterized protein YjdB